MTQGLELDTAEGWLYATLHADSTLETLVEGSGRDWLYNTSGGALVPTDAVYPLVTYQFQSGVDVMEVSSIRIMVNTLYLVSVWAKKADFAAVKDAAARLDVLLHRAAGTTSDGTVFGCRREDPFRQATTPNGVAFRRAGGIYRLFVQ